MSMVFSLSVNERGRLRAFVHHAIAMLKIIVRRGDFLKYSREKIARKSSVLELGIVLRIFHKVRNPRVHVALAAVSGLRDPSLSKRFHPGISDQIRQRPAEGFITSLLRKLSPRREALDYAQIGSRAGPLCYATNGRTWKLAFITG